MARKSSFCSIFYTVLIIGIPFHLQLRKAATEELIVYKEDCALQPSIETEEYPKIVKRMLKDKSAEDITTTLRTLQCQKIVVATSTICKDIISNKAPFWLFQTRCSTGNYLKSFFSSVKVLNDKIVVDSNCAEKELENSGSIRSRYDVIPEFILDIMTRWGWRKLFIFTDFLISDLLSKLSESLISVVIIEIVDVEDVHTFFRKQKLNTRNPHNFITLCNPINTRNVLQTASDDGLLTEPQKWIIISELTDTELFNKSFTIPFNSYVGLATTNADTISVFQGEASLLLLQQINTIDLSGINALCNQFTIETNETSEKSNNETVEKKSIEFELMQVYSVSAKETILSQKFGKWSPGTGLDLHAPFPNMLRNLDGHQFIVASVKAPPYVDFEKDENDQDTITGIFGQIFMDLANEINFTWKLESPTDNQYGSLVNGKWTGIIGMLTEGKADIGLADLSMTPGRKTAVDFSEPIDSSVIKIFYRKPEEKFIYMLYIMPFEWEIWLLIVTSIVVSGVGLYVTNLYSPSSCRYMKCKTKDDQDKKLKQLDDYTFMNCVMSMYNGFVQQGAEINPPDMSSKIIFITIYLSFVIVFSSYTSIFTSFLTIKDTRLPIENLDELLREKRYKIGMVESTSIIKYIEDASSVSFRKTWDVVKKDPKNIVPTIWDGLQRAYEMDYALLAPQGVTIFYLKTDCRFVIASEEIVQETLHIVFRKNFTYQAVFSEYIKRLVEGGIIRRIKRKYERDEIQFCDSDDGAKSLGFKRVVSLFMLLSSASVVAAFFLLAERCCCHRWATSSAPFFTPSYGDDADPHPSLAPSSPPPSYDTLAKKSNNPLFVSPSKYYRMPKSRYFAKDYHFQVPEHATKRRHF